MGGGIAGCAHSLEKSALGFMDISIHRLLSQWRFSAKLATTEFKEVWMKGYAQDAPSGSYRVRSSSCNPSRSLANIVDNPKRSKNSFMKASPDLTAHSAHPCPKHLFGKKASVGIVNGFGSNRDFSLRSIVLCNF